MPTPAPPKPLPTSEAELNTVYDQMIAECKTLKEKWVATPALEAQLRPRVYALVGQCKEIKIRLRNLENGDSPQYQHKKLSCGLLVLA